jgi:maltooligosyltrehalose trehalohydrolase
MNIKRKYPIGAEFSEKGVNFRVWAPDHAKVYLVQEEARIPIPLINEENGYFSLFCPHLGKGTLYKFGFGRSPKENSYPDPASRYQPSGVVGPSEVIDPKFPWEDEKWKGIQIDGQIIYELHVGTFTLEGTLNSAAKQLEALSQLGVTLIELMPLNEFPGKFGWGYDGINLFAPYHHYGTPEDLKAFINKAHQLNLGVILDVVYNHFGPDGNFLTKFTHKYFNPKETTEWGSAINFEDQSSREFFLTNARYWIEEFHFDGLRIDATPWFFCNITPHILAEITKVVKKANPKKKKIVIGESETQDVTLLKPFTEGGYQFDALWNDDFHHTALVRLKGKREAYYTDYTGTPQEFISAFKYGFLYQGQYYDWQHKNRGTFALTLPRYSKIIFLENHDQIANTAHGKRLYQLSDPGNYRTLTCLLLLGPNIPMLFQGQEFSSSSPFYYFADHKSKITRLISKGRKTFLAQFPSLSSKEAGDQQQDPSHLSTFIKCKLHLEEREKNSKSYLLHKNLIKLRKEDAVFQRISTCSFDGAVLNADSFLLRFFGEQDGDRLMIINFGANFTFNPDPEPLLVAGDNKQWEILWSSDDFSYGGEGIAFPITPYWEIPGHSATVLKTKDWESLKNQKRKISKEKK